MGCSLSSNIVRKRYWADARQLRTFTLASTHLGLNVPGLTDIDEPLHVEYDIPAIPQEGSLADVHMVPLKGLSMEILGSLSDKGPPIRRLSSRELSGTTMGSSLSPISISASSGLLIQKCSEALLRISLNANGTRVPLICLPPLKERWQKPRNSPVTARTIVMTCASIYRCR